MSTNTKLAERLRAACATVRTKSMPLADLIPLMQQAADKLAAHDAEQAQKPVAWSITVDGHHCGNLFADLALAQAQKARLDRSHPNNKRLIVPLVEQAAQAVPAELEKAHEARRQAQAEAAILKGDILKIASAVSSAGFTLVKTEHGYQVRKFGQAVAQAAQAVPADLIAFLDGRAPLDGVWFGELHPTERGAFWWRKYLRAAPAPEAPDTADLAIMLRRCASSLKNLGREDLAADAMGLLERKGLQGSPLRGDEQAAPQAQAAAPAPEAQPARTEAEGEAYTEGYFDGVRDTEAKAQAAPAPEAQPCACWPGRSCTRTAECAKESAAPQAQAAGQEQDERAAVHVRAAASAVLRQLGESHPREEIDLEAVMLVAAAALAQRPQAAPAPEAQPSYRDAYEGAREDLLDWKRRALEAEELNRKFMAAINGPTFMGEPAPQAQAAGQELPPLPKTSYVLAVEARPYESEYITSEAGYSEDDLREYARAAVSAALAQRQPLTELRPIETAPKTGEFLIGVWSGDWDNPRKVFKVHHAYGFQGGPSWAMKSQYRTEEGGAYELAGWMPLPAVPGATTGKEPA